MEWLSFFAEEIRFLAVAAGVLLVPGWVILRLVDRRGAVSALESVVISLGLSLGAAILIAIALSALHIPIEIRSLAAVYGVILAGFVFLVRKYVPGRPSKNSGSRAVSRAFLVVFLTAVAIKAVFFAQHPVPISTDLGHHTYWIEKIIVGGQLPVYEERDIIMASSPNEQHRVSEAKPISDVIMGEHVPFAFVAILSGTPAISLSPAAILFLIHIATILAVYVLACRLFARSEYRESVAVVAVFVAGVLFALDSPQMKYIVGGVVGNTLGNILILSAVLTLVISVVKRSRALLAVFVALVFTLAYTHHLSTLLFAISLFGMAALFLASDFKRFRKEFLPMAVSLPTLLSLAAGVMLFFFLWPPSYIANRAAETVVGQSENEEHLGITLGDYLFAMGDVRMLLGLAGLLLLAVLAWKSDEVFRKRRDARLAFVVIAGWTAPLLALVFFPSAIGIDIPTIRTANYTILPMAMASAVMIIWAFRRLREEPWGLRAAFPAMFAVLFAVLSFGGLVDNAELLRRSDAPETARELHRAAAYLGKHYRDSDRTVLYDHISIEGGAWMKLYFLRDYNYPFYRAHLFRYDRADDRREKCTLWTISSPDSAEARKCFEDLRVGAIALGDAEEGKQFREHPEFTRVYDGRALGVYVRGRQIDK
mgnify:CR=1 FL=1